VYSTTYRQMQSGLSRFQRLTGIPPTVKRLDGEVIRKGEIPVAGGIYTDVWEGEWLGDRKVALKSLRGIKVNHERARTQFEREVRIWSRFDHPNVLKFIGIVTDIGHFIHMVSPWQENGNILDCIRKDPDVDRLHFLTGAANGLAYLHSPKVGVVHGNLRATNILVTDKFEAVICDFGMAKVVEDITEQSASQTLTKQGSARWLAPELIEGQITSPTFSCDIYSFAMTMFETFTLQSPYQGLKRDAQVIHRIFVEKRLPDRPVNEVGQRWVTEDVWNVMKTCWTFEPEGRPKMNLVADELNRIERAMTPDVQMSTNYPMSDSSCSTSP